MPYDPDFARLYSWVVHGEAEPEATPEEMGFLAWAFRDLAQREVRDVLDAGCGQGRVLVPLAEAGWRVTGLDNSPDMLNICRERLKRRGLEAPLTLGGIESLGIDQGCDAVVAMDSVVCYALETEQLLDVFRRFRTALRPGGVLVLDNWNMLGNWPLLERPQSFGASGPGIKVTGEEKNRYDSFRSLWEIEITADVREGGRTRRFRNTERLRALTIPETEAYLRQAGFTWVRSFRDYRPEDESTADPEQVQVVCLR